MPNVVGAVTTIAAVVAAVTKGIAAVIAAVTAIVGAIITAIYSKNAYMTLAVIGATILSLTGALKFLIIHIASLAQKEAVKIAMAIWEAMSAIWDAISKIIGTIRFVAGQIWQAVVSIFGRVRSVLISAFTVIKEYASRITRFIHEIVGKFVEFYSKVKASIVGKIMGIIKKIADFLSSVHTVALAYDAFRQKKYLKSIFIIVRNFDDKLASEINDVFVTMDSLITQIMSDVEETFSILGKDITTLSGFTSFLGDVLSDIAHAFGIKDLAKVANWLDDIKNRVFGAALGELRELRGDIFDGLQVAFHPLMEASRIWLQTGREKRELDLMWEAYFAERQVSTLSRLKFPSQIIIPSR